LRSDRLAPTRSWRAMPKVFVSYRRTDTELIIGRIRERLE
jgi:hypothetical protein